MDENFCDETLGACVFTDYPPNEYKEKLTVRDIEMMKLAWRGLFFAYCAEMEMSSNSLIGFNEWFEKSKDHIESQLYKFK